MKIKVDLIKEYIIDTINNNDESLETAKEKMQFFVERHETGFNCTYYKRLYPNLRDRIAEYLSGISAHCLFAFSIYDIDILCEKWGINSNEYWTVLAENIIVLCNENNVCININ